MHCVAPCRRVFSQVPQESRVSLNCPLASFLCLLLTVEEFLSSLNRNLIQTDTMVAGSEGQTCGDRLDRQTDRQEDGWRQVTQTGRKDSQQIR